MLPPEAPISHIRLVRDTAGIAYFISLFTLAFFVVLQRVRRWPTRAGTFNVWVNLPTFDPTAGGDVVIADILADRGEDSAKELRAKGFSSGVAVCA